MDIITEQLIDRFIADEMLPEEQQAFIKRMELEPELKEQVIVRKLLLEAEAIKTEQEEYDFTSSNIASRAAAYPRRSFIPIMLLMLILAAGIYWGGSFQYETQKILADCYERPKLEFVRQNIDPDVSCEGKEQIIARLYTEGELEKVVDFYHKELNDSILTNFSPRMLLCVGASLFEKGTSSEFMHLYAMLKGTSCREDADWLLLCYYLKQNKRSRAMELATQIEKSKGMHSREAQTVYKALKEKRWF